MKKTKTDFFQILVGMFIGCLLISNILAAKTFTLGSVVLPSAVIIFPLVYIVNDVLAEVYGYKKTRSVIWLGFAVNALAVLVYNIAMLLPAPAYAVETAAAFEVVLGSTVRMLAASFAAYLVGSLVNAKVMAKMKARSEKGLMLRCILSTLIGEGLDAIIFITIAFWGVMPLQELAMMVLAQATFKTVFEFFAFPATKIIIDKVKALKD